MTIADRYLLRALLAGLAATALLLLPLFGFFDLIGELDEVGKGSYSMLDALRVSAMLLPRRLIELAPFIVLLGSIAGLGYLASGSELVALFAAGFSVARLALLTIAMALLFSLTMLAMDQWLASPWQQQALAHRAAALQGHSGADPLRAVWWQEGTELIRVADLRAGRIALGIELFEFDHNGQLQRYRYAERADIGDDGSWQLLDVTDKDWRGAPPLARYHSTSRWQPQLPTTAIAQLLQPPAQLAPLALVDQMRLLQQAGQQFKVYQRAFWQRLSAPLLAAAMGLLALPLCLGQGRSYNAAARLALASLGGLLVYLLQQIVHALGALADASPLLSSLLPTLLLLLLAWLAVLRRAMRPQ